MGNATHCFGVQGPLARGGSYLALCVLAEWCRADAKDIAVDNCSCRKNATVDLHAASRPPWNPFGVRPEVVAQPKKTCVESKRFLVDHRLGEVESLDFITVCQHIGLSAYSCSCRRQCHGVPMFESVVGLRDVCSARPSEP